MTELCKELKKEGIRYRADILTVDEMVMNYVNYNRKFNTYI